MTFEEVKPGQLIEHDKTYHTEWLFILSKSKSRVVESITVLVDTSDDVIEKLLISKLVWDEDYKNANILINKEEARARKHDIIYFIWISKL